MGLPVFIIFILCLGVVLSITLIKYLVQRCCTDDQKRGNTRRRDIESNDGDFYDAGMYYDQNGYPDNIDTGCWEGGDDTGGWDNGGDTGGWDGGGGDTGGWDGGGGDTGGWDGGGSDTGGYDSGGGDTGGCDSGGGNDD